MSLRLTAEDSARRHRRNAPEVRAMRSLTRQSRRVLRDQLAGDEALTRRCPDCGEPGERAGHMGCQYPQDRA
jgi:hypothetical protein